MSDTRLQFNGIAAAAIASQSDATTGTATDKLMTAQRVKQAIGAQTITDYISGLIESVVAQDYMIVVKAPYAGTITNCITRCASGTATFTFKINSTALGGTANSVSTSEQDRTHSTSNTFAAGDDIVITASSVSSCRRASFTIVFTRTLG